MKRFIVALALLLPSVTHAQYLQEIHTSDYSFRTFFTQISPTQYHYEVQFRNEQLYDPNRVFSINSLYVSGLALVPRLRGAGFLDDVYRGPLPSVNPAEPALTFYNFFGQNSSSGASELWLGIDGGLFFQNGYGLLGCSIPTRPLGSPSLRYDGDTCSTAGQSGWRRIWVDFYYATPTSMTAAGISAQLITEAETGPTYNAVAVIVPEPSTWALMLVALPLVWWRRRARR